MMVQTNQTPQSLWRERANQWLNVSHTEAPAISLDQPDDDHDPDPPPAAPSMRPWPRVVPGL
ncbi:hypothetical protein DLREEDagr8_26040 [Dongia sp. agr-C8]